VANKYLKGFFDEVTAVPAVFQNSYYPSLDGLRGIAILMVVLSHLRLSTGFAYTLVFNGGLGVLIFFVLSGFLITGLCLKEKVITGNISLKNFYFRRVLRIFPVAYLYLLLIIILKWVFKLDIHYISILGAAVYLMDISSYFRKYYFSWHTGHYWSLSVEEQFYLIVPFILKKWFRFYLLFVLFIIFVLPFVIVLQYHYPALNTGILYGATHILNKFQAIAVGCLFAVIAFKYGGNFTIPMPAKILTNIVAIGIILYLRYDDFFSLPSVFSGSAIAFLTGYIIITNLKPSKDLIFRVLNTKFLKLTGVLSYSIYIWQQPFTSNDRRLPHFLIDFPYNIIWIIAVSSLSYFYYERFFLGLKAKFSKVKSKPIAALNLI
jgi:peptidoglycan/LPS O-acetylase OafA/YrhL